ncbi:anti-sigma factor domain-containing protein [Calidithermus chliarophilus]|uniref:anti-sigma factor n=1 Tax=Calidithermus chliarophilus TaxID=52023 RepID=UPI000416A01E|nr:anti-sigma factor [Calidithermus chliarophilus]
MKPEEARELLPLYALDALSPEERARVEAALGASPQLQAELRELQAAAADLALALPPEPLPEGLEERVLASLPPPDAFPAPIPLPPVRRRVRPLRWLAPAVAAAALLVVAWVGSLGWGWVQALGDPQSRLVTLVDAQGNTVGRALVRPDRQTLMVLNLPRPAPGKVYQAWGVGGTVAQPIPLETFRGRVVTLKLPSPAVALAISEEPGGGSQTPTDIRALPKL